MTRLTGNKWHFSRRRILEALAAGPLILAGCSSLVPGQGPPPDLYRLTPESKLANLPHVTWQLEVEAPEAPASLDSTKIALLHNPIQIEYYARANWVDRAPLLIQALLIDFFEFSGAILSVGRNSADVRADYALGSELRDFQADYSSGGLPQARVGINAHLTSMARRSIVATKRFDRQAQASADAIQQVVAAFNTALGLVLDDIVAWTIENGETDRKSA